MAVTSTTGTISSPGLSSGLDVDGIIQKLVALERQPITNLQTDAKKLSSKLSSWGQVKSAMSTLRDAALAMNKSDTWGAKIATSGDNSITVSADATAAAGSYSVEVLNTASSQSLATNKYFASDSAVVGTGTLTIQMGTWNADQSAFTADSSRAALNITIGSGENTLAGIRDKINAAGGQVTASIVTDSSGSRLVLRGPSGESNGFTVGVSGDSTGTDTDADGLSALAFNPASGVNSMAQSQAAADAKVKINGLTVTSKTNEITAVNGVSIKVSQKTTTPIGVSVDTDKESISKAITAFATAYTAVANLIKTQTAYNSETKVAGTLQGDATARTLQSQLRTLVGSDSGASTVYKRMSDIGLSVQADGSLTVNSSKLNTALSSGLAEVKKLFANSDVSNAANDGMSQRMRALADNVLGAEGSVTTRSAGIQSSIDRNNDRQEELEDRVAKVEARLRAQYTALDASLAQLNSLSTYVTQQLSVLNNSSS